MAARGPGTTLSALRAFTALIVVVLFVGSVVFFGYVLADSLDEQFGDGGESNEGPADDRTVDGGPEDNRAGGNNGSQGNETTQNEPTDDTDGKSDDNG